MHVYSYPLGKATNNEAEFAALEQGLQILIQLGKDATIVEGDSLLAINATKKLQNGSQPGKVTKHWRLSMVTLLITTHLTTLNGIVFQAVRHTANAMVDVLANHAVENLDSVLDTCWQNIICDNLCDDCLQISAKDLDGISGEEDRLQGTDNQ